jgi:hypothetical protein
MTPASANKKDYFGVVVWLERRDGKALTVQPKTAQMAQKQKQFVPSVLAVPVGSRVSFPNFDPIFHNAFSTFAGQIFDVDYTLLVRIRRWRCDAPALSASSATSTPP